MKSSAKEQSASRVRVILGGGGNARQSLAIDTQLVNWMAPSSTLLYWPFALPEDHPLLEGCESWIASVFHPLGITHIETWHAADLAKNAKRFSLDQFGGIYIGGGNTFRLLEQIRRADLEHKLIGFISSGGPVSGGSAGAVILGKDIGFAEHFGDRNESGLRNTAGLNVILDEAGNSCLVLPHFVKRWRAKAQRLSSDANTAVIGIEEDAGVIIEGFHWRTVGSGQVTLFRPEPAATDGP
jgi:dipeptidase E